MIKKAEQSLHFLRVLRKYKLDSNLPLNFHLLIHQEPADVFHDRVVWQLHYGRQGYAAEGSQGSTEDHWLPSPLPDGHLHPRPSSRTSHTLALFNLLPSGRHYRSIKARTNRLKNSIFSHSHTNPGRTHALTVTTQLIIYHPTVQYLYVQHLHVKYPALYCEILCNINMWDNLHCIYLTIFNSVP